MFSSGLVKGSEELGNSGRDLESSEQNSLLSLDLDVSGPSDKSALDDPGSDVLSQSEISFFGLAQGVLFS